MATSPKDTPALTRLQREAIGDVLDMPDDDVPATVMGPSRADIWTRLERLLKAAGSLGVALAAGIAVMQYIAANHEQRSERSLDLVKAWQEQELDKDFEAVRVFVEPRHSASGGSIAAFSGEMLAAARVNLARTWLLQNRASETPVAIEPSLDNLTLFFSQMEVCIRANLCDETVLRLYFASEVLSFWAYFEAYALLRREANYEAYGESVDALVARFEKEGA